MRSRFAIYTNSDGRQVATSLILALGLYAIPIVAHAQVVSRDAAGNATVRTATAADTRIVRRGAGRLFRQDDLEHSGVATLGEFLQRQIGLRVGNPTSARSIQMSRDESFVTAGGSPFATSCHVGWFVDDQRMDSQQGIDGVTDALAGMALNTIAGIEIFHGLSEMPVELAEPDLRCGAIAIWTRRGH